MILLVVEASTGCSLRVLSCVLLLQTAWFRLILLLPRAAPAPGTVRSHLEKNHKIFLTEQHVA